MLSGGTAGGSGGTHYRSRFLVMAEQREAQQRQAAHQLYQREQQQRQYDLERAVAAAALARARQEEARRKRDAEVLARLSAEQRHVLEAALEGRSLFFTGRAGTGKSFLLREIIAQLQHRHGKAAVYGSH